MKSIRQLLKASLFSVFIAVVIYFVVYHILIGPGGLGLGWQELGSNIAVSFDVIFITFISAIVGMYIYFRNILKTEFTLSAIENVALGVSMGVIFVPISIGLDMIMLPWLRSYANDPLIIGWVISGLISSAIGYIVGVLLGGFTLRRMGPPKS